MNVYPSFAQSNLSRSFSFETIDDSNIEDELLSEGCTANQILDFSKININTTKFAN